MERGNKSCEPISDKGEKKFNTDITPLNIFLLMRTREKTLSRIHIHRHSISQKPTQQHACSVETEESQRRQHKYHSV